jgi:hypothetical protein
MGNLQFWARSIALLLLVGCGTNSGSDEQASTKTQAVNVERDECALLDDPGVRSGMSGALELKLLLDCGRISAPPATAEKAGRARSPEAAELAEQLGETDSLVSDPALDTGGSTQSETSVVANGLVVCAAWNDAGEGFGVNGFSGFGFSSDGGVTFADGGAFPNGPSDTNRGDPSLVYSVRDSAYYYGALSSIGLSMWRSTNGCQSFQYVGPIHAGGGDDKELMAVDNTPTSPFYGRIHVGWTNFSLGTDRNQTAFSDDGGLTWSPAVTLAGSGPNGQGMYPAVAPNGDVYMALRARASGSRHSGAPAVADQGTAARPGPLRLPPGEASSEAYG